MPQADYTFGLALPIASWVVMCGSCVGLIEVATATCPSRDLPLRYVMCGACVGLIEVATVAHRPCCSPTVTCRYA